MIDNHNYFSDITLLIPTYNCGNEIKKHLKSLQPILGRFGQIIIVDSYSDDGTYEIIRKRLLKYDALIYQRERGLYQSWNDAIYKANKKYCYISTIGDLPNINKIEAFFKKIIDSDVDVGISPPSVIKRRYPGMIFNKWPIHHLLSTFNITEPIILEGSVLKDINSYIIFSTFASSLSGSFASNLTKTKLLKTIPLPTEYEGAGDVLWWLKICELSKVLLIPEEVCTFLDHKKSHKPLSLNKMNALLNELFKYLSLDKNNEQLLNTYMEKYYGNKALRDKYGLLRLFIPKRYSYKFGRKKMHKKITLRSFSIAKKLALKIDKYKYSLNIKK